jgi:hypothetical protein
VVSILGCLLEIFGEHLKIMDAQAMFPEVTIMYGYSIAFLAILQCPSLIHQPSVMKKLKPLQAFHTGRALT